ncbi:MAG: VOC family protein [Magnetococcales bacterium]|nr:VOC family protein [Magnetococcales bacterium]
MALQLNLVTLGVDDLDEAILFYEDALGFTSMAQEGNVAIFSLSNSWLALLPKWALIEDGNWVAPKGDGLMPSMNTLCHHVASKSEVDQVIAQAVEAGAQLLKPPKILSSGEYSGYFSDPNGHLWRIIWNPFYYSFSEFPSDWNGMTH